MNQTEVDEQLRWVLKDKYNWSDDEIEDRVQNRKQLHREFPEVKEDEARLAAGEPIAYVIGWVTFLGCRINLAERPLVPRPETEYWTQLLIEKLKKTKEPLNILDLCCGSGCIGIALLKHLPNIHVTFVDISDSAIKQTRKNLELNDISPNRFTIQQSNLFAQVSGSFDVIVTNPPYVDVSGEYDASLVHEPPAALFAQDHGLGLIQQIILNSKMHLKPHGKMVIEFGLDQGPKIAEMLKKENFKSWSFGRDQYDVERWVEIEI